MNFIYIYKCICIWQWHGILCIIMYHVLVWSFDIFIISFTLDQKACKCFIWLIKHICKLHAKKVHVFFALNSFKGQISSLNIMSLECHLLLFIIGRHVWWSWSYGSWIYNYRCNQCLLPLKLWFLILLMARCTRYNIMW
jgi:hypothetical protein